MKKIDLKNAFGNLALIKLNQPIEREKFNIDVIADHVIKSAYASYRCPKCGHVTKVCVDLDFDDSGIIHEECDACKSLLTINVRYN